MKVLFVNPSIKKETQHPLLSSVIFSSPPLGLGYIAAYLRHKYANVNIKIIDETANYLSDDKLKEEINNINEPLLVGISCLTATFSRAIELARKIKSARRDSFIVFGGVHPSALPEESLESGVVDVVIRNEGEVTMTEIYEAVLQEKNYYSIKGISYIRDGKIIHNPNREYVDLNTLPKFPYDLFEDNIMHYSDFGLMITSRGCPFDCIFCSNRLVTGRVYRTFNIDYVIEQINILVEKYNQKSIFFGDDNIVADKKRFFSLMDAIMEKGLSKRAFFNAQVRGEDLTEDVLECMKKANFKMIASGVETSSERLLNLINKKGSLKNMGEGIRRANAKGLLTCATFIFGLPSEQRSDRINSARLSRALPIDSARFNIAIPYPGTKLFEIAKQEGSLNIAPEWRNFNVQYYVFSDDIPYIPKMTGKYTLMFDTMWSNIRFYMRLKIILTTFFKTDITGGNVISFQNRKNNAIYFYFKLIHLAIFIFVRFIYVSFRAIGERINPNALS